MRLTRATSTSTVSRWIARGRSPARPSSAAETHGASCGHESVPHGDHVDYDVGGALHHPHAGHCDLHGLLPADRDR